MKIVIVTTLYNAEDYIDKCISSIKNQSYSDFLCYITDDISTDSSIDSAKKAINGDNRFILLKNKVKAYQPGNYDYVIRHNKVIHDEDIIVELDGDDWFPDKDVLKRIIYTYNDSNIWIANGSFIYSDGRDGFSRPQTEFANLRSGIFTASHIRTWKAKLWRKIQGQDLKCGDKYWPVAGDLSFMFPMLEMAGESRYKFMDDINYVYNEESPLNDHKVNLSKVQSVAAQIRSMPPYKLILNDSD